MEAFHFQLADYLRRFRRGRANAITQRGYRCLDTVGFAKIDLDVFDVSLRPRADLGKRRPRQGEDLPAGIIEPAHDCMANATAGVWTA